jgi:anti-sigma regulatory factor (Ser/Thr protein kinase)
LRDHETRARRAPTLELRVPPEWGAIQAAWEPCRSYLLGAGMGEDEAYQLAMVVQELLENAVKYGAFSGAERIGLGVRMAPEDVTVEVKSRVGVDDANLRRFDQMIQWIRGFQNPFEAYVERLKLVSARPYSHGESGLGLARIAYEGRCTIDFYVDEGNVLAVSAVYRRDGGGA